MVLRPLVLWRLDRWPFCNPLLWCLYECNKLLLAMVLGPLVLGAWIGDPFGLPCYGAWLHLIFENSQILKVRGGTGGFLAMPWGIEN